jgi:cytochrome d ubiquinol oxidase subunit I
MYGTPTALVTGLDDIPADERPPIEVVYYAYHIMVGLGTLFILVLGLSGLALWRRRLYTSRTLLWVLMLAMPFPYIANEAGWTVSEVGRQPWMIYGLVRTAESTSTNVSGGMTVFTLMGFMGLYLLIGALYTLVFLRILHQGPAAGGHGAVAEARS